MFDKLLKDKRERFNLVFPRYLLRQLPVRCYVHIEEILPGRNYRVNRAETCHLIYHSTIKEEDHINLRSLSLILKSLNREIKNLEKS